MGIILSRIRKKKSTIETLEKLDNDIKEIEESRTNAQRKYKRITKLLLIYSSALYVLCGLFFYFQYNSTLQGKLLYLVPLAISPLLLYIIKRIISWYFTRLINKNQIALNEMKKEKKRILDEVMDKETYKVAKQILEKFASENIPKPNVNMQIAPVKQHDDELRKRISLASNMAKAQIPGNVYKDFSRMSMSRPSIPTPSNNRALQGPVNSMVRLPAPILPLERGYMDRVVEYLIGDGPNNRYALICSRCHSHNGMALKEEFEYIGFKCCYCFHYNPARKIRPEAPRLEKPLKTKQESDSDSDSKTSGENSESEPKVQFESGKSSESVKNELGISDPSYGIESNNADAVPTEESCDDETQKEEENTSSAIMGAENDEKETTLGNIIEAENDSKKETTLGDVTEAQNDSNQSENDAHCDQSLLKS